MTAPKIQTDIEDDHLHLEIQGNIDEDFDFTDIVSTKFDDLSLDLHGVKLINSCGVREWINFLDAIGDKKIIYQKIPQLFVEQMNMVKGLVRTNTEIESFYAPYYSAATDKEYRILLKADNIKNGQAPKVNCPDSGDAMEFDAIEDQYFRFLELR